MERKTINSDHKIRLVSLPAKRADHLPVVEAGEVGFAPRAGADIMPEGYIVPEPFDQLNVNSASGMPSILDQAFKAE